MRPCASPTAARNSSSTVRSKRSASTWCWANSAMSTLLPSVTVPASAVSSPSSIRNSVVLPAPFGPDQGELLPRSTTRSMPAQHGRAVEAHRGVDRLDHHPGRSLRLGERELGHQLRTAVGGCDPLELLERLHPALHLAGLGRLVAEPLDELLGRRELSLLGRRRGLGRRDALLALDDELLEAADVLDGAPVRDLDHPLGHRVDEVAVVADEQDRAGPLGQVLLQPRHRLDVEVVGGLVEHQQVGSRQHQAGQRDPHAPAARELAGRDGPCRCSRKPRPARTRRASASTP